MRLFGTEVWCGGRLFPQTLSVSVQHVVDRFVWIYLKELVLL